MNSALARLVGTASLARVGNEMWSVGVVLLVLDRTGSAALAGACVAAVTLPSLVTGPVWGARLGTGARRRAWLATDQAVAVAALVALVAMAGNVPDVLVVLPALLAGITFPLSTAGFSTVVPDVVDLPGRPRANALDAATYNLAQILGPAIAAGSAALLGPAGGVLVQAGIKLVALLGCALLPLAGVLYVARPILGDVRAGVVTVVRSAALRAVTVTSSIALAGRGLLVVALPLYAAETLDLAPSAAGVLWTAMAAGAVAGTVASPALQRGLSAPRVVVLTYGLGGVFVALWPLASALSPAVAIAAAVGLCSGPALAATFSVRQGESSPELFGQVSLTGASLKTAGFAAGSLSGGLLAARFGPEATLVVAGAANVAAGAMGAILARLP